MSVRLANAVVRAIDLISTIKARLCVYSDLSVELCIPDGYETLIVRVRYTIGKRRCGISQGFDYLLASPPSGDAYVEREIDSIVERCRQFAAG